MNDFKLGAYGNPSYAYRTIKILDAVQIEQVSDLQTPRVLTLEESRDLAFANYIEAHYHQDNVIGSPDFGGTLYRSFDGITEEYPTSNLFTFGNSAPDEYTQRITRPLPAAQALWLIANSVNTLNVMNSKRITFELRLVLKS